MTSVIHWRCASGGTLQLRAAVSCARGGNASEAEDRLGHAPAAAECGPSASTRSASTRCRAAMRVPAGPHPAARCGAPAHSEPARSSSRRRAVHLEGWRCWRRSNPSGTARCSRPRTLVCRRSCRDVYTVLLVRVSRCQVRRPSGRAVDATGRRTLQSHPRAARRMVGRQWCAARRTHDSCLIGFMNV
jgi:hypothetical protein